MNTATITKPAAKRAPTKAAPTTPDTKLSALAIIGQIMLSIGAAQDAGDTGDSGDRTLGFAWFELKQLTARMERAPLTSYTSNIWLHSVFEAQAIIEAVAALGAGTARGAVAQTLRGELDRVVKLLDNLSFEKETEVQRDQRDFMDGMALAVKLLQEARTFEDEGRDDQDADARFRGRGVAQTVFVRPYLEAVALDTALLPGFAAALSSAMPRCGDMAGELADLEYEDCIGGPNTKYAQEEESLDQSKMNDLDRVLRRIEAQLFTAGGLPGLSEDADLDAATKAVATARAATSSAGIEAALQEVRKHVYIARDQLAGYPDRLEYDAARAELLELNRLLCKCLGGQVEEDRADESSPLRDLIGRLDSYMQGSEHIPSGDGPNETHRFMHSDGGPWALFYEAFHAEARGHDEAAIEALPALREALEKARDMCGVDDGCWPLFAVSVHSIGDFLAGLKAA